MSRRSATPPAGTYVALLRGINVGGKNRVPMAELREGLATRGIPDARTYIASGNVLVRVPEGPSAAERVRELVAGTVLEEFGVTCAVLVLSGRQVTEIADALPREWVNDEDTRADVLYLFADIDEPGVLDRLSLREGVDQAQYTPGAVLWSIDRAQVTRSHLGKIIGGPLYPYITIRNASTARRLAALVAEIEASGADGVAPPGR